MDENERPLNKINDELMEFQKTMEELSLLQNIAQDLKSFKRMIRLKRYD